MSITFACQCGKSVTVPDEFAGRSGTCKGCGAKTLVPSLPAETTSPPHHGSLALPMVLGVGLAVMTGLNVVQLVAARSPAKLQAEHAASIPKTIDVEQLRIVDASGKVHATFGLLQSGKGSHLVMMGGDVNRAELRAGDGENAGLFFHNQAGIETVRLASMAFGETSLAFKGATGQDMFRIEAVQAGLAGLVDLRFIDHEYNDTFRIHGPAGAKVELKNNEGTVWSRSYMPRDAIGQ